MKGVLIWVVATPTPMHTVCYVPILWLVIQMTSETLWVLYLFCPVLVFLLTPIGKWDMKCAVPPPGHPLSPQRRGRDSTESSVMVLY